MVPRLKEKNREAVVPSLRERFVYRNNLQVPRLEKIVVTMGVGEGAHDPKAIDGAMKDMALITGQKPRLNRARKSVAGFKLRTGMSVGCKVTLRGDRMFERNDGDAVEGAGHGGNLRKSAANRGCARPRS